MPKSSSNTAPAAGRPVMPKGYGIGKDRKGLLSWTHVEQRMTAAHNYWVCTTRPNAHPHAMPVWGVWIDAKFYFGTDSTSRKARNLVEQPAITLHLESGDDVLIVEGAAAKFNDPRLLSTLNDAYHAKYGLRMTDAPGDLVIYAVTPLKVFAWSEKNFPANATRWLLESSQK